MKRLILTLILLTFTLSAPAQTTVSLFVTSQQNQSNGGVLPSGTRHISTRFEDGDGFGLSLAHRFGGRLSGELGFFRTSSDAGLRELGTDLPLGSLDLTTVTAMARFHFLSPGALDLWAGAGGAYVTADDLDGEGLRDLGLDAIPLDSETTAVIGGGAAYDFSDRVGIALDLRWLPLSLRGEVSGEEVKADADPLLASLGLRVRF